MLTCHFYWIGRHSGHGLPGHLHDAVLLRLEGPQRARVSQAAFRREDAGVQRHLLRRDDDLHLRAFRCTSWRKIIDPIIGVELTTRACSISAVIVLVYIFLGGLTSAIYNEVLQFFLIVLGFLPVVLLGLKDVGGW